MQKIQQDLNNIQIFLNGFKKSKKVDAVELSKALERFSLDLGKLAPSDLTPFINQRSITLLSDLERELDQIDLIAQKTVEIKRKILALKEHFVLKIAFLSDLDESDTNGYVLTKVETLFENQVPFITTRSLIKGSKDLSTSWPSEFLEQKILIHQSEWDIFEYENPGTQANYLVFIPKAICKDKKGLEKLKSLDLNGKKFREISAKEALTGAKYPTNTDLSEFFSLFNETATTDKLFYISGHGGENIIAGLEKTKYLSFLSFLNKQRCKGLLVNSCYAGGLNSLVHLPYQKKDLKEETFKCHFPIVVQSIGDFAIYGEQDAENEIGKTLNAIAAYGQTIPRLRNELDSIENYREKSFQNFSQIFPQTTGEVPYGFRAIEEGKNSYALTLHRLRLHRYSDQPEHIEIEDKEYLMIYPTKVSLKLHFKGEDPILLSQVPGDAAHYIEGIRLFFDSPLEYIKKNKSELEMNKTFFIARLEGRKQKEIFENVVLFLGTSCNYCIYQKDGYYFYCDKQVNKVITPFQYTCFLEQFSTPAENQAKDSERMVVTTCGQEEPDIFIQAVRTKLNHNYATYFKVGQSTENLVELFNYLTEREKIDYFFYLIQSNQTDLVLNLLEKKIVSDAYIKRIKNFNGQYLLHALIKKGNYSENDYKLAELLIQKMGTKINTYDPISGNTPLHLVVLKNEKRMFKILLESPNINVNTLNQRHVHVINCVYREPETLQLLIAKGAQINTISQTRQTPLCRLLQFKKPIRYVKAFLDVGANPNLGNPSALYWAAINGDRDIVDLLLRNGATLTGTTIFELPELILRSHPEMIKMLLSLKDYDINQQDSKGRTCLTTALQRGDDEIIQILLEKGAHLPDSNQHLEHIIKKLKLMNDKNLLKKLLFIHQNEENFLATEIIKVFSEDDPEFLVELLNEGLINPNQQIDSEDEVIDIVEVQNPNNLIEEKVELDLDALKNASPEELNHFLSCAIQQKNKEAVAVLLKLGADPNFSSTFGNSLILIAIEKSTAEIVEILLQFNANILVRTKTFFGNGKTPVQLAKERNDPKILKLVKDAISRLS